MPSSKGNYVPLLPLFLLLLHDLGVRMTHSILINSLSVVSSLVIWNPWQILLIITSCVKLETSSIMMIVKHFFWVSGIKQTDDMRKTNWRGILSNNTCVQLMWLHIMEKKVLLHLLLVVSIIHPLVSLPVCGSRLFPELFHQESQGKQRSLKPKRNWVERERR